MGLNLNLFNYNENNKNDISLKTNKNKYEQNKYKFSTLIKNLDIWDKEHCSQNKIKRKTYILKLLKKKSLHKILLLIIKKI